MYLGTTGIWSLAFTHGDRTEAREAAAELEELGYGTIWLGGSPGGNPRADLATAAEILASTSRGTVATGCVSIWDRAPAQLAAAYHALPQRQRDRLLVGLGVSHADFVDRYHKPYRALSSYLDALDASTPALPPTARIVGAHGPQMTRLAAAKSMGAHPYLVAPAHTAWARSTLGEGPLLALEQTVLPHCDADSARVKARTHARSLPEACQLPRGLAARGLHGRGPGRWWQHQADRCAFRLGKPGRDSRTAHRAPAGRR